MRQVSARNKRVLLNIIMVVSIFSIMLAGMMIVGNMKGWFDKGKEIVVSSDGTNKTIDISVFAQDKLGSANIERNGIAYSLKDGTRLRDGDIIETLNGSSISIVLKENNVRLNQDSEAVIHLDKNGVLSVELIRGEAFIQASETFNLSLMGKDVNAESGVLSASKSTGSASIYVFEGKVNIGEDTIKAGQAASILSDQINYHDISIKALNDFNIENARKANKTRTLCFSNEQLDKVTAAREAEKKTVKDVKKIVKQQEKKDKGGDTGNKNSSKGTETNDSLKCTIEIRCDTILDNMGDLKAGKNKYVPSNGCILTASKVDFNQGETVFDVLKRACSFNGIQLEYSWTPMYDSYYIEGINNLYEFDCGNNSGWMFKVNGWFPNYGCSSYKLKDGDVIVWCYTCKGLGTDVGGSVN